MGQASRPYDTGEKMFITNLARRAGSAVGLAVIVAVLLPAGAAKAAPVESAESCATLLSTEKDRAGHSIILARSCSSSPEAAAAAFPARSVKLMTWYADAGWRGNSDDIYGSQGTCDEAGYTFATNWYWQWHMSSIRGHGRCNQVLLKDSGGRQSGWVGLPWSFGASHWNDNVNTVKVAWNGW
jgi:hypothetical protein